jgi:CheY-like chemotaxis protein
MHGAHRITILIADDDEEDRMMTKLALEHGRLANDLRFVEDGEELMDYLRRRGKYHDRELYPDPGLILLDLNMPRKDGREALSEIKRDPEFRRIPVVVLTTSRAEEDIFRTYDLGVNSFVSKPVSFQALVEILGTLSKYWLEIVELPAGSGEENGQNAYQAASGG